jgi:hypothetical protein
MRTGSEIVSDALKLLGNETLTTEAEVWLNNVLARLYEDHRWPFQEKTATGTVTAGATAIALPADFADFWDRNGLRLQDSNGNLFRVIPLQADDFDLVHQPGESGPPQFARIDLAEMEWQPSPVPETVYTWILRYKKSFTEITDFTAAVDFPNDPAELNVLENMTKKFRRGYNVSPTKGTAMRFQSQTFKGISAFK